MKDYRYLFSLLVSNPKLALIKIDGYFFRGIGQRMLFSIKEKKRKKDEKFRAEHPEEWYDRHSEAVRRSMSVIGNQEVAVNDLVAAQFVDGVYKFYDMAVRLLAIDQYYGKNSYGFDLYSRMQAHSGFDWVPRFTHLIESYEQVGFVETNMIEVDEHLTLMDGAHRLALALYHHKEIVPVRVYKSTINRLYDYSWFWGMNYTKNELKLIHDRTIAMFSECLYDYVGVIWPPAFHLRDEIIDDINFHLNSSRNTPVQPYDCNVTKYFDLCFDESDFIGFMRAMYYPDYMTEESFRCKLQRIMNSMPDNANDYSVRVYFLKVNNPDISRNAKNNTAQSQTITKIKKAIRGRYENRVRNYEYDVLMHITDNYIQSKFCSIAVGLDRDLSDLFSRLNVTYEYVIIKSENRQSKRFPRSYYYNTEIDLLVHQRDVEAFARNVETYLADKYGSAHIGWFNVERQRDEKEQVEIIVSLRGWRCVMFHIQTISHYSMNIAFGEECIENRVLSTNEMVYVLPEKYELILRAAELIKRPDKEWHKQYILKNKDAFDSAIMCLACGDNNELFTNLQKVIGKIIKL